MASDAEICSNALRMLGCNPIISLTDQSTEGRLCNGFYESTRDELISMHPWNFCKKRIVLASLVQTPSFEFNAQYELPSDCLHVIKVYPEYPYKIEGRKLLAHSGGIQLLYKARIEDPGLFPAYFVSALEACLAAKMAYPLTRQLRLEGTKYEEFLTKLGMARVLNDHEDTPDVVTPNVLTSVRRGG